MLLLLLQLLLLLLLHQLNDSQSVLQKYTRTKRKRHTRQSGNEASAVNWPIENTYGQD